MAKVYVYCMYGLGGRMFSAQVEDYIAENLRKIGNVIVPPTRGYTQWRGIVEEIKMLPSGSKVVTLGHSMGAAAATYPTDHVRVDLVVCYDCAGQRPSGIGRNTGTLFDFQDTSFAFVPKFRPWAYPGHNLKIVHRATRLGHVQQPSSSQLLSIVLNEVKQLVNA